MSLFRDRREISTLRVRRDFLSMARVGLVARRKCLVLQYAPYLPGEARGRAFGCGGVRVRVGFTITRKVGIAVERNRIRRRLRDAFRRLYSGDNGVNLNGVYVVIGGRAALSASFSTLFSDLNSAVSRLCGLEVKHRSRRD